MNKMSITLVPKEKKQKLKCYEKKRKTFCEVAVHNLSYVVKCC